MRGFTATRAESQCDKWMRINQLVREQKIAILAVQETHLTEERVTVVRSLFEEHLRIEYSSDPINGGAARGVAFVINLRVVKEPIYTV